jgi:hypothetical protein
LETAAHQLLKLRAAAWLRESLHAAVALEVACPISRYRVDVAGYLDGARLDDPSGRDDRGDERTVGATTFIECKASRSDFLRDTRDRSRLLAARERLHRELAHVQEEFVKPLEPHLRGSGSYLFDEMERWDFELSRSHAYRAIVRELRRVDAAIYDQTKFFMLAHYRLADRLFIMAVPGVIEVRELPRGWGLLVLDSADAGVRVAAPANEMRARSVRRLRTLRNIAAAASRRAYGASGFPSSGVDGGMSAAAAPRLEMTEARTPMASAVQITPRETGASIGMPLNPISQV